MPLGLHDAGTFKAQLHTGKGVDGVVDAVVPGYEAPEHLVVRGVHDGIGGQARDVALPQQQAVG